MSYQQITFATILGAVGLAISSWGLAMALGPYPRLQPMTVAGVLAGGLALIALTLLWLTALLVTDKSRRRIPIDLQQVADTGAVNLPNREPLLRAINNLQNDALSLIERRREIHHLNTQQWAYVHDRETTAEIEATKQYRSARRGLEIELQNTPPSFWGAVEWFSRTVERSLATEIYSLPGDPAIHESIQQHSQEIARLLDQMASESIHAESIPA